MPLYGIKKTAAAGCLFINLPTSALCRSFNIDDGGPGVCRRSFGAIVTIQAYFLNIRALSNGRKYVKILVKYTSDRQRGDVRI